MKIVYANYQTVIQCLFTLIILFSFLAPAKAQELENVAIQLKGLHQFQFAGYYAAKEKGFFKEEGIDVTLYKGNSKKNNIQSVLDGDAEYGVADAGLILEKIKGKPVVLLKQIFQHSPQVLITRQSSGITNPFMLQEKRVMADFSSQGDTPVVAMFFVTLGGIDKLKLVEHKYRPEELLNGNVEAMSASLTSDLYLFKKRDINIIKPRNYGVDFYGDNLFTTEQEVNDHPERVKAVIRATLKGWRYAIDHSEEVIQLILKKYNSKKTYQDLTYEAEITKKMIAPDESPLGTTLTVRFEKVIQHYIKTGHLDQENDWSGFLYQQRDISDKKATPEMGLRPKDKIWLDKHPVIKIGIMNAWPPLNYVDTNGLPKGIGVDFLDEINKHLNGAIKIVPAPFVKNYNAVKEKKLDAVMDITPKKEREAFFHFTQPYLIIPHVIVGRKDGPYFNSVKELTGKKVALEKGFYNVSYFRKMNPGIIIKKYPSTSEALGAVSRREADVYAGNRTVAIYLMEQELITNLQLQGRIETPPVALSIGVRRDWPELASILNRLFDSFTPEKKSQIQQKWLSITMNPISLSVEERKWLKKNPVITVHNEEDWGPFNFNENGKPKGFSIDYMNLVAEKAGFKVNYKTGSWNKLIEMTKNNRLDVMLNIAKSSEREKFLHFTEPYFELLVSLFVRNDIKKIESIQDLYGKRVAVMKGSYVESLVKKHPEIRIVPVKGTRESVIAVSSGNADALYDAITIVNYYIHQLSVNNIRAEGEVGIVDGKPVPLHIAVSKDKKILASIINTAMASVNDDEIEHIRSRWMNLNGEKSISPIQLTPEEKRFLTNHPTIKVANEMDFPPFDFNVGGRPQGYSIDLINLMAEKIGVKIDYVNGYKWYELVEMFKRHEIDLLHTLQKTPAREQFGLFSDDYRHVKSFFVSHIDFPDINKFSELNGKIIAVGKGWDIERFLDDNYPMIKLLRLDNAEEMLEAVLNGDASATVGNVDTLRYTMVKKGMSELKVSGWAKEYDKGVSEKYRFMAQKDAPELISLLNKALAQLSTKERRELDEKWFVSDDKSVPKVSLTTEEKNYLEGKGVLRMCVTPDWLPYGQISEDGRYEGIGAEIIQLIAERINTPIELVATREWNKSLQNIKDGVCDILPVAMNLPSRQASMNFTLPYSIEPFVIATRRDELFVKDAKQIGQRKVGVIKNSAFSEVLISRYPDMKTINVKNSAEGLRRVQKGELFGYIDTMPTIGYIMQEATLLDLKIAGRLEFAFETSIASRSDEPILASIMQKAVDSISEEELQHVIGNWLSIRFEQGVNYTLLWKVLSVMALLFAAGLFWVRRLSVMNYKIRQANLRVEEASRAKSEFLANMSHEIRTPLNAVTGFSELLSSLVTDQKQKSYLEAIKSSGKNLLLLINDILDLSKIEAGKLEIHHTTVDLKVLLQEIKQIFALQVSKKDIGFTINISDDLPAAFRLDEIRLRQVLINIVGNAVKFTDKGRIELSVDALHGTEPSLFDIHILVKDTGIGILENEIATIFDSFKQQSGQDSSLYGGTGLGLAICKRLIEMMNGEVVVESEFGKGSSFKIILKDVEAKHKSPPVLKERPSYENIQFEKGKILVVDDVDSNRYFLKELLSKVNLEVLEAHNGHEAVVISFEYQPDIILMDLRMPVMDGFEAAAQLKNNQITRNIPIIAVTASSSTIKHTEILNKGFNGFLTKPVEIDKLFSELLNYLSVAKSDNNALNAEEKDSSEILTARALSDLQELIVILETDYLDKWKRFKVKQPMQEVKKFGSDLKELGSKSGINSLVDYGESLITHVDNFDISSMQETIDEFPVFLSELKILKEDNT